MSVNTFATSNDAKWGLLNYGSSMRILNSGSKLREAEMETIRDPAERLYRTVVYIVVVLIVSVAGLLVVGTIIDDPHIIAYYLVIGLYIGLFWFLNFVSWKLAEAWFAGHAVEVASDQYPQIYTIVEQACAYLDIKMPRIYIYQGEGLVELFVAKRFTRKGIILITSNFVDELSKKGNSRGFMMLVGRQLGHIKFGHFRNWFFKDVIGLAAIFFHSAYWRHCHISADRVGLLCSGDLYFAEQGLLTLTVGSSLAAGTNYTALLRQKDQVSSTFFGWLQKILSHYPYMVVRIVRLREFALTLGIERERDGAIGVLPIHHVFLQAVPVLIIHGHDRVALLELQNMLLSKFPNIVPRIMLMEQHGALSMSEKFENVTGDVVGAIALLTPDDQAAPLKDAMSLANRARQNVVMEIGWAWGKLGRTRCLLLKRGDVELPSDLSGADVETYHNTPNECVHRVQSFVEHLERQQNFH